MTEQEKQDQIKALRERQLALSAQVRDNDSLLAWLDTLLDLGGEIATAVKTAEGIKATADARRRIDMRAELDNIEKQLSLIEAVEADQTITDINQL